MNRVCTRYAMWTEEAISAATVKSLFKNQSLPVGYLQRHFSDLAKMVSVITLFCPSIIHYCWRREGHTKVDRLDCRLAFTQSSTRFQVTGDLIAQRTWRLFVWRRCRTKNELLFDVSLTAFGKNCLSDACYRTVGCYVNRWRLWADHFRMSSLRLMNFNAV